MILIDGISNLVSVLVGLIFNFAVIRDLILCFFLWYFVSWILHVYERVPRRPKREWKLSSLEFHGGKKIEIVEPATGVEVKDTQVFSFTGDEINEVVRRAHVAQKEWANTSFAERRAVLRELLKAIVENQDEICRKSASDSGKTLFEAEMGEILTTCEKIRYLVNYGEDALRPRGRRAPLLLFVKKAWVEYHPLGVIAIIVPYNFPFHNVFSAVVSSIFAGNAAVVKVSEGSVASKDYIEAMIRRVLAQMGHNPELVTLVAGYGETGSALVQSNVSKILFIGSPATGKKIMQAASTNLTPVILELGGKDPLIVYPDAQMEHTLDTIIRASFFNCGQNCISSERIYVQDSIYDKVAAEMERRTKLLRQGPPSENNIVDVGAITMEAQIKIVDDLVQDALKKGAQLLSGGKRIDCGTTGGRYYQPTVLKNVTHEMRIANEEAFGPVMSLIRWTSEDDLIEKVNSTPYGLGGCVFSSNYPKAEAIARKLSSDMVCINDFGLFYLIQDAPFGGSKDSGFGRFNGPEGLREFSRLRLFVTDRFHFPTYVPALVKYPFAANAQQVVKQIVFIVYGSGIMTKIKATLMSIKLIITKSKQ